MAEKGQTTGTQGASTLLVPANGYRNYLVVQLQSSTAPLYLAFGEDAVSGSGYAIGAQYGVAVIAGPMAREAVYGVSASASTIGYQEDLQICD